MIKTEFNHVARLMLATSVIGLSAGTALAQAKPPEPAEAPTEVVVVGVRKSLAASRDLKRDDARVIDAIVAEDIAQFPQKNMAEALQRVSGVQLRRDFAGGVGNEISLRGLSPDYTAVTLNGQAAPSGADSRSFNFNTLPAELFRSVEVSKSPNARTDEGGIGGMVSLETLRPADLRGRKSVFTLEGTHNAITDQTSPRGTLVVGNTGERFGWVAGLTYSEFGSASQSYDAVRWRQRSYKLGTQSFDKVWLMDLPRYIHEQQSVDRLALTLAGQFVVSPDFKLMADAVVVQNNQDYTRNSPIYFFEAATGLKDISVKDGIVEYASFGDVRFQAEDLYGTRETETRALRLRGQYQLGTLQFNPFVTVSDTQFEQTDLRYFADVRGPAAYDIRQDDDYFTITSPIDVASAKGMLVRQARRFLSKTVDREAAAGLDLSWSVSETLKAEFGFKLRDRSKARDRFEVTRNGINQPFEPVSKVMTGFLTDEGRAKGPNSFVVFDPDAAFATYGSLLDPRTSPQINNYFKVKERVSSAYAMATYQSDNWLINGGLRLTATALTSDGVERNQTLKTDTRRSISSDYADVLPSLNVRYEVMPNLYLRGSAAKVLTRPSLTDLAAYREINDVTRTISARNPDLKPFRADQADLAVEWYFGRDGLLGLGWFHKDIKSFIATRSSQVDLNGTAYTLTQPVNGNSATVSGFEANYQQSFDFLPGFWRHFGVAANYTYTDSSFSDTVSGTSLTYGLPENSEDSYNLTGYYEDDRLSVRVAHNFRGAFLREIPNPVDGIKIRDDYQQTDVSVRWTLSPDIQLTMDVMNVFESQQEEYVYQPRLTDGLFTTGRTWQAGLRAKF